MKISRLMAVLEITLAEDGDLDVHMLDAGKKYSKARFVDVEPAGLDDPNELVLVISES